MVDHSSKSNKSSINTPSSHQNEAGEKGIALQRKENKGDLPSDLQSGLENMSGKDMSDVTVNYNSATPGEYGAHAITQGKQIDIAPGQEQHLPHEAWHVVQQKQGRVPVTGSMGGTPVNTDTSLEKEADVMGARAMQMKFNAVPSVTHSSINSPVIQGNWKFNSMLSKNMFKDFGTVTKNKSDDVTEFADEIYKQNPISAPGKTKSNLMAEGLYEWSKSAINAAKAYYAEFDDANDQRKNNNVTVMFGISDFTDADFRTYDFSGTSADYEIKRVTARPQGSVDKHLRDANRQLNVRTGDELNAIIHIASIYNPWPYTPTTVPKNAPSDQNIINTAKSRNIGSKKKWGKDHNITIKWDSRIDHPHWHMPAGGEIKFKI